MASNEESHETSVSNDDARCNPIKQTSKTMPSSHLLHKAVELGNQELVETLLYHRANVDFVNAETLETPLQVAIRVGSAELVRLLLDRGADVNHATYNGLSPLHLAVKKGDPLVVSILLDSGARIDAKNNDGLTPLAMAVMEGNLAVFKEVLRRNANVNSKCQNSKTALHFAAENSQTEMVEMLLQRRANPAGVTSDGKIPLHLAAEVGNIDIVKLLLNKSDKNYMDSNFVTPLHVAVKHGHTAVVRLFLEMGAALESKTIFQETPLHYAAVKGHEGIIDLLLSASACINVTTKSGDTPLHSALRYNYMGTVELLLQHGANINCVDESGNTPLIHAIENNDESLVMLLLDYNACVNATGRSGPPLYYAIKNHSPFVGLLIERGANVNYCASDESTMLHYAIEFDNAQALEQLLMAKADIMQERGSRTALQFALTRNFNHCAEILLMHCYEQHKRKVHIGMKNIIAMDRFMITVQRIIEKEMKNLKPERGDGYRNLKAVWNAITVYTQNQFRYHRAEENGLIEYMKLKMKMRSKSRIIIHDKISSAFIEFILRKVLDFPVERVASVTESLNTILNANREMNLQTQEDISQVTHELLDLSL